MRVYQYLRFEANEAVGTILDRYRGVGPGFDLLRIILAIAIFYGHTRWIAGESGMALQNVANLAAHGGDRVATAATQLTAPAREWLGITRPLKLAMVPMFFALSGFLVTGSAIRLRSTSTFLAHRSLRIFPALVVETTLAALILGPLLTTLPLREYLSAAAFTQYFGNIVGQVWYVLPGVFTANPLPNVVNANLWTLPSEFYCYLLMAAAMFSRLVYHRSLITAAFVVVTLGLAATHLLYGISTPDGPYATHVIVYYFFVGVMFFQWKNRIPANVWLFIGAGAFCYASLFFPALTYLTPLPLVYVTVFFGLIPLPKIKLLQTGDYSYGVYLYGFPIAQSLVAVFPAIFISHALLLVPAALAVTMAFSVLSWHLIEKRALAAKRLLPLRWFPMRAKAPIPVTGMIAAE